MSSSCSSPVCLEFKSKSCILHLRRKHKVFVPTYMCDALVDEATRRIEATEGAIWSFTQK